MAFIEIIWRFLATVLTFVGVLDSATDFTNVEYTNAGGDKLYAYLATPPNYNESKTYPVAIVYHAWNGIGLEPTYFADLLAENGEYVVLAPDLFRGVTGPSTFIPWNIFTLSVISQEQIDQDIDAAIAYLETLGTVDTGSLVSGPGFCFGGSQALELSKRRSTAGTVSLYGSSISELQNATDEEAWGLLGDESSPILGIYGALDGSPSVEEVNGFENGLKARGIKYNITIYDDVGHAFVTPEAHSAGNAQAVDAWDQVMTFMEGLKDASVRYSLSGVRREVKVMKRKPYSPSFEWMMDHMTDNLYHKGHANHFQG